MPWRSKYRLVSCDVLRGDAQTAREVRHRLSRRRRLDREHDADRTRGGLRVVELGEADDLGFGLLDPVAPGDPEVEAALGHVARDLLRTQDADVVDTRVVDGGPVVDVGAAGDTEVGVVEELQRGPLERALGQNDVEHGHAFGEVPAPEDEADGSVRRSAAISRAVAAASAPLLPSTPPARARA